MNILVYVISLVVLAYNEMGANSITWEDFVVASPDSYYSSWYGKEVVDDVLYATSTINVRTQPKSTALKLGYAQTGEALQVTAKTDNGWYEVRYNDRRGYVSAKYVTEYQAGTPIQYKDFVYHVGGVDEESILKVLKSWEKIPENVRNSFIEDGSKLIITDEHLGKRFHNDTSLNILGVTSFYLTKGNCEMYIYAGGIEYEAILHEIGHYIDGKLSLASSNDTFLGIWAKEVYTFSTIHKTHANNLGSSGEYFAEACSLYIKNDETFKQSCFSTYSYIQKCFSKIGAS